MRADEATAAGPPRHLATAALCTLAFLAIANLAITSVRFASTGIAVHSPIRLAAGIAAALLFPVLAFRELRRGVEPELPVPEPSVEARSPARGRRRRLRRAQWLLAPVVIVVGFVSISGQWDTVTDAVGQLAHLDWRYVRLAVYAEALSMVAFALAGWILLRGRGARLRLRAMIALTLASNALSVSLPAGQAVAATFSFDQLRRRGVSLSTAARVLIFTMLIVAAALVVLLAVGVELAGGHGPAAPFRIVVEAVPVALAVALAILIATRRLRWPRSALAPRVLLAAFAAALGNWVTDCACLVASILAVGGHVPWSAVLVIYGVGQIAENLPITPGGVGVVEGTLSVLLVGYGMHPTTAVAAVLVYRIISFWIQLPIGLAAGATLHLRPQRVTVSRAPARVLVAAD
jgi:putative heme transporter